MVTAAVELVAAVGRGVSLASEHTTTISTSTDNTLLAAAIKLPTRHAQLTVEEALLQFNMLHIGHHFKLQ